MMCRNKMPIVVRIVWNTQTRSLEREKYETSPYLILASRLY